MPYDRGTCYGKACADGGHRGKAGHQHRVGLHLNLRRVRPVEALRRVLELCVGPPHHVRRQMGPDAPVSEEMRARVAALAKEMGYEPAKARGAAGATNNIGVLVSDRSFSENTFYTNLYRSLVIRSGSAGYTCMMEIVSPEAERGAALPSLLSARKADGILFMGNFDPAFLRAAAGTGIQIAGRLVAAAEKRLRKLLREPEGQEVPAGVPVLQEPLLPGDDARRPQGPLVAQIPLHDAGGRPDTAHEADLPPPPGQQVLRQSKAAVQVVADHAVQRPARDVEVQQQAGDTGARRRPEGGLQFDGHPPPGGGPGAGGRGGVRLRRLPLRRPLHAGADHLPGERGTDGLGSNCPIQWKKSLIKFCHSCGNCNISPNLYPIFSAALCFPIFSCKSNTKKRTRRCINRISRCWFMVS